jgi:hypothetical protein
VVWRCSVTDGIKELKHFNVEPILSGFGATQKEAEDDFIRRNKSDVLDKVFYD